MPMQFRTIIFGLNFFRPFEFSASPQNLFKPVSPFPKRERYVKLFICLLLSFKPVSGVFYVISYIVFCILRQVLCIAL